MLHKQYRNSFNSLNRIVKRGGKMTILNLDEVKKVKLLLSECRQLEKTIKEILASDSQEMTKYGSFMNLALFYNDLAKRARQIIKFGGYYIMDIEAMGSYGSTHWPLQKAHIESILLKTRLLISNLENQTGFVVGEVENIVNFIKATLRSALFEEPKHEKDVQNALETLLIGKGYCKGNEYDREAGKIKFSGKEYIPDFTLQRLRMCIEVKLLNEPKKRTRIIEEINADITAYSKEYENLVFVVYDIGVIRDQAEFCRDLESKGASVIIVKH